MQSVSIVDDVAEQLADTIDDPDLFNDLFIDDGHHFWSRQCEDVRQRRQVRQPWRSTPET